MDCRRDVWVWLGCIFNDLAIANEPTYVQIRNANPMEVGLDQYAWAWMLSLARLLALLTTFAVTAGSQIISPAVRVTVATAICLPVAVGLAPSTSIVLSGPFALVLLSAKEVLIGFLLGFAVSGILIWAVTIVGELVDNATGMNNAQIFSPTTGQQGGPMPAFLQQLATVLFLASGGLQLMIQALYTSYRIWPLLDMSPTLNMALLLPAAIELGRSIFAAAVQLAAPVILILILIEVGMGFAGRHLQSMNISFLAQPVKGVVAMLALMACVVYLQDTMAQFRTPQVLESWWRSAAQKQP